MSSDARILSLVVEAAEAAAESAAQASAQTLLRSAQSSNARPGAKSRPAAMRALRECIVVIIFVVGSEPTARECGEVRTGSYPTAVGRIPAALRSIAEGRKGRGPRLVSAGAFRVGGGSHRAPRFRCPFLDRLRCSWLRVHSDCGSGRSIHAGRGLGA